jgi:hypothetical protein
MKYIKMLGFAAVAATALMAFLGAGTAAASQSVLCKTAVNPCPTAEIYGVGTVLDFSLKSGTSALLTETGGGTLDTCTESTVKSKITVAGGTEGKTATGENTSITWGKCTFPTVTVTLGKLKIDPIEKTTNGTLTADSEIGVTINTVFFGSCVYGVKEGSVIGTLTSGAPASFDANATAVKLSGSAFACPETSKWTATYVATEPAGTMHVETSTD